MLRRIQEWAVLVFVVTLPMGQSPADIALVVGLLAWVARLAIERHRPVLPSRVVMTVLIAWFLIAVGSMVNTVDVGASLDGLRKLLKNFAWFLVVIDTVNSPAMLQRVLKACVIGLAIPVVDGLWQGAFDRDLLRGFSPSYALNGAVERIQASFHHPGSLGSHLATFAPLAVVAALRGPARWRRPLWLLFALTAVAVVLTRSRGSVLALLGGLLILGYWLRHWAPAALGAVTALAEAATAPPAVKAWAATMPTIFHQLAEPDRFSYWQAALNMITAHPVIGVGANTFVKAYPAYRVAGDPFTEIGPYAHNLYLHQAAELGLLGLAVLGLFLGAVWMAITKRVAAKRQAPTEALVNAGLGAGMVGYLIAGLFESSLFHARGSVRFWFLAALILAVDRIGTLTAATPRSDYTTPVA